MTVYKNSKSSIRLPLFLSIAVCVGMVIGALMVSPRGGSGSSQKNYSKFRQVMTYIENDYVDEVSSGELVEDAIELMLQNLDPHTTYIPASEMELIEPMLLGKYEGIGIEFNIFKDTIHVVAPLSGGPSEKLGILPGDKIIKVDGVNVASVGMNNEKVVRMLRGEGGSEVTVAILRDNEDELIDFTIIRDEIPQFSVDVSYMVDENIGYIKVSRFANSTYMEFKAALLSLKDQGMKRLIIDLTGNPGGYLNRAVEIVDELLSGEQLIVFTDGKEKRYTEKHFSGKPGDFESGEVVIMIDEGSASASEIVAGAIQDHDRGFVVGRRSFGKGLVQLPIDLDDGSELRLTISRYYTPSGRSIQKPYNGKPGEYHLEAYNRYLSGELYEEDSIKNIDSLTFQTDNGRVVYGGGGITPDYFAPLDSSSNSAYLNRLFSTNSVMEYTVKYAQENGEKLNEMGYESYLASFEVTDQMLADLIATATSNGLKPDPKSFEKSKDLIKVLVKAYIARGVWENDGFYPIFNQRSNIYKKAVEVLQAED